MENTGIITTYRSGVDVVVEWKIEHFFTLLEMDGAYYFSPDFSFGDETWRLWIYPNGSSRNDSSGHVNMELCRWSFGLSIKQSFSLSLKTVRGKKYNEQHVTKDFDNLNKFHEFYRYIPRSELSRRRSELVPEGDLTIICTMKSSSVANEYNPGAAEYCPYDSDSAEYCPPDSNSAEYCPSDSDSAERSSDSGECCYKCSNCLDIVKRQKKLLEELENQKERSEAGEIPEHPFVEVPTQNVEAFTQSVDASTQTVEASIETVEVKCEACASGSSIGFHDDELRHDLKELFLKREDCDIIIRVKDSEFPAHRIILKARSPVFASTFRHGMKEDTTGVLEIEDCDSSTFSDFLCFLYCGDVGIISQENVFGLFTAADKYQVLNLRAKCLEFMKKNIAVDTFCEIITLALRHSEIELIKLCTDYFKENIPKIIVTVKWQIFLAENPTESNELLVKCFVPNSS